MINYQDSLQLQINSPLDAKACNYYREAADFVIEPIAKYLERVIDVYRAAGVMVTVLEAKEGHTPIIGGDGLIRFSLIGFPSELVNFDIKYYTFVDGLEDVDFQQISFGYTYVAYASDDTGTGFSLTPSAGLNYTAILVANEKINTLVVGDFDGLWHKPEETPQVQSDWSVDDTGSPAHILERPVIPAAQVQVDYDLAEEVGNMATILNKPTIPAAQVQSDWGIDDDQDVRHIIGRPDFTGTDPAEPTDSIQFNRAGNFGGNQALRYKEAEERIYFKGATGSGIYFSSSVFGPQIWTNATETQFGITNTVDDNLFMLDVGKVSIGQTNVEPDTFLQIADRSIVPFLYALKIKNNINEPLLAVKNDGSVYIQKLAEGTASQILYIDPTTGLITRGAAGSGTELTASATSGIDVDGGDSSSDTSIEITQNDSKLGAATAESGDSIGFYDEGVGQKKTTLGNLPGWDFQVDDVSKQEVKIGSTVNVGAGTNVTLEYIGGKLLVNALASSLDLYVDNVLEQAGTSRIDIIAGSGINLEYNDIGEVTITSTAVLSDGLRSGGSVVWLTGFTYAISLASYVLGGVLYSSPATTVTLSAADPTFSRIDVIAVNDQGTVEVIQGIPAADPQKPSINPITQIALTYVLLLANTVEPEGVTDDVIYDENNEWTTSSVGVTVNFNSLTDPFSGTVCADVGTIDDGNNIWFVNDSALSSTDFESISLFLKLKASVSKFQRLFVSFYNGVTSVSNEVELVFDKGSLVWQPLSLQLAAFSFTSNNFDSVLIAWNEAKASPAHDGFYLDLVKLQTGVTQVVTSSSVKLVGDVLADGETGSPIQTTLATVNPNVGTFGAASTIPIFTVDEKGRITGVTESFLALVELSDTPPVTDGSILIWFQPNVGKFSILVDSQWVSIGQDGAAGSDAFVYIAYATDAVGSGWSMTPTDSLKYRAEIQTSVALLPPTSAHFANATWVKYLGDNQSSEAELNVDFLDLTEFVYNVPQAMRFDTQVSEGTDAALSISLGTTMAMFDKLTITPTQVGLIKLIGVLL